ERSIAVVHQVRVGTLAMSRVKRVIANHGERLVGQAPAEHLKEILVVPPGKVEAVEAAARFIDAAGGPILGYRTVGIFGEELRVYDALRKCAADRERVADDRPLG